MRLLRLVTGTLMVVALVSASSAGRRKARGFVLDLVPSQNATSPGVARWKTGAPVFLLVTMVNDTNRIVHYSLRNPAFDYEMEVRDACGTPVPETEWFHQLKQGTESGQIRLIEGGKNMLVTLNPGETGEDTVALSSYYDLRKVGEYSVTVKRKFPDVDTDAIELNRLDLSIVP